MVESFCKEHVPDAITHTSDENAHVDHDDLAALGPVMTGGSSVDAA